MIAQPMTHNLQIINADCLTALRGLAPGSVHCCVTSPPYWGLRDYGVAGQLGLERTPEEYVARMVEVFREVWRVLREDGTCWVNLGDSYASNGGHADTNCDARRGEMGIGSKPEHANRAFRARGGKDCDPKRGVAANGQPHKHGAGAGLKPKDLVGIPWRVGFALQADGWWLRQDIIWHKPNPMPESVTDRFTKAHEYIFLLTKSARYYFDQEAILEPCSQSTHARLSQNVQEQIGSTRAHGGEKTNGNMKAVGRAPHGSIEARLLRAKDGHKSAPTDDRNGIRPRKSWNGSEFHDGKNAQVHANVGKNRIKNNPSFDEAMAIMPENRNKRSVWTVPSAPYSEAHFDTIPPNMIKPCIMAGTSARGACAKCGAPWERIVERGAPDLDHQRACGGDVNGEYHGKATKDYATAGAQDASATKARILAGMVEKITTGWKPTCECGCTETVPCAVLDPFGGSGTTGQVALELGRRAILIELNPQYIPLIENRTNVTPGLNLA